MRQLKLIIAALFLISPFAANADPISYNYDDFGYSGAGMFTLDLSDDSLGTFGATDVMGGPGAFLSAWTSVALMFSSQQLDLSFTDSSTA